MTEDEVTFYLSGQSLTTALWWFIENAGDQPWRNALFFYLRKRMREEGGQSARAKHKVRGTYYDVLTMIGNVQSDTPLKEGDRVVIYRGEDGKHYIRPFDEFVERFEGPL